MNNTTTSIPVKSNGTRVPAYDPFFRTKAEIIAQTASLAVLGVIVVCGNLASIITFLKSQSLRRRSHYLIISLSAADLLVGVVDFMCVYFFWTGPQRNTFLVTLEVMDTLTGIASILTLSNIAIERFYAIFFPFRHRRLRFRVYVALCAFPWITATYVSALYFTSVYDRSVLQIYNYHAFSVATLALVFILFSYITIGVKLSGKNNPGAQDQNRSSRDQKLAVTLLIVTLASLLTWMPLQGFLLILYFCRVSCKLPHFNVLFLMKFLQFCNSGINVFIYIIRMPEFRRAFLALFCKKSEQNMRVQDSTRMTSASMRNNGFVGDDQMRNGQSCRNGSMDCPRNTSNPPSYNNLQKAQSGNVQGSYQTNKNNVQNQTNQTPWNCYNRPGSENLSRNHTSRQTEVTKDGEGSLEKIDISFGGTRAKESGYQQDVTNHEYKYQPEVKKDGDSSLKIDDLGVARSKKTGYQQGVANHGYEKKACGIEDSQL